MRGERSLPNPFGRAGSFPRSRPAMHCPGRYLNDLLLRERRRRAEGQRQRGGNEREPGVIEYAIPTPHERRANLS